MWESLFNKVPVLQTCNFIKKRLQQRCFPVNTAKFLRTVFFIEHLWWPLLPFTSTFQNFKWEHLLVICFTLTHPNKGLNTFKLITEKVDWGVSNLFKIKQERHQRRIWEIHVHSALGKHLKKVLDMLQVVNKETKSQLLTYKTLWFPLLTLCCYLKGSVNETYKVSWCLFVERCCRWTVECGHEVWYMLCSWWKNAHGLVYLLIVAQTTWFRIPNVCSTKGEWVEHRVEYHEIRDGINV